MNKIVRLVKDLSSDCCVSIILNTHRTHPENVQDAINLKNLVKEAETRINNECKESNKGKMLIEKLNQLANSIDHRHNLESLVLYVNDKIAEYERLPIEVTPRVVIGDTFATRDLLRALHKEASYYVLVLSRDRARLIEAFNDKVVREEQTIFPMENESLHSKSAAESSVANRLTNLTQEFFNIVDKKMLEVIKENPHPVLISTDEQNYQQYQKIADRKEMLMGHLPGTRMDEKAHHIVSEAWNMVSKERKVQLDGRISELNASANSGKVLTDLNDIWQAVRQGRGKTIFVKKGFFQPVSLQDDTIEVLTEGVTDAPGYVDDIIDDMIEFNIQYGGDSVFLEDNQLEQYNGLALTTRF
ncbi:MAG TPA: hypothetical protein VLZ83_03545 [Edaphocola sp.]|nr:hypothetical protein [Edaphocola sp.]